MHTTTAHILAEIAPKITQHPAIQAAALISPEAFEQALTENLRDILEAHDRDMRHAFNVLADIVATQPTKATAYFGPRISAALHAKANA